MANRELLKEWINESLLHMPVNDEEFFKQLWRKGKIYYDSETEIIDEIDEISSQLACAAFEKNIPILFVLPDQNIQRGAVTFATILIKYAVRCISNGMTQQKVLYFGSNIKFKHAIQCTYVGTLPISHAFSYIQASGKYDKAIDETKSMIPPQYLPEVICVYNPLEPEEYINKYKPRLVVIDCGRENKIDWLTNLVSYCKKKSIPIISWSTNFYNSAGKIIEDAGGSLFFFPSKNGTKINITDLFLDNGLYNIQPVLLVGGNANYVDKEIYLAKQCLKKITNKSHGKLQEDGLRIIWKYLKSVETLVVPLNLYNAEATSFWGIHSLIDLQSAVQNYIAQISKGNPSFAESLNECFNHVNGIVENFKTNEPPLWASLKNYCVDNIPDNGINVIIFPKKNQKLLFAFSLLSRCNISENELRADWKTAIITLKEYSRFKQENSATIQFPILVGLPGVFDKEYFYDILADSTKILLFPNQLSSLKYLINEINSLEKEHLKKSIKTLKRLSGFGNDVNVPAKVDRFSLSKDYLQNKLEMQTTALTESEIAPLLNIGNLDSELSSLFEQSENDSFSDAKESNLSVTTHNQQNIFVNSALEISFVEGYKILVSEDDQLNVIKKNLEEGIYSRAVKVGDRVLVILDQARQNLFDLILSRVHSHPSLEVHFAMLRKWREELYLGHIIWKDQNKGKGIEDILRLLQGKGSQITTANAVGNWLSGVTLRPQDEQDILRVGKILDTKFIVDNYKLIALAAQRVVGIHISLARKLNDWITKKGYQNEKNDSELIDEQIGLTLGDIRSSIRILTVQSIVKVEKQILENSLGILEKK